jgi:hypothetical protein
MFAFASGISSSFEVDVSFLDFRLRVGGAIAAVEKVCGKWLIQSKVQNLSQCAFPGE